MAIEEIIRDLAAALKGIGVARDYKEKPIPWKRLIAALAASVAIAAAVTGFAAATALDSDIPAEEDETLIRKIRAADGKEWECSSSGRKVLREHWIDCDGILLTSSVAAGVGELHFTSSVLPTVLYFSPSGGYLEAEYGGSALTVYIDEDDGYIMIVFGDGDCVIFESV